MKNTAALGMILAEIQADNRSDRVHERTGFFIKNGVCAPSRVNREEAVVRHFCDILSEHACGVNDDFRAKRPPVRADADDFSVFHLHTRYRRIQRHSRAVHNGVFGVSDCQSVRADTARGRIGNRKLEVFAEVRLTAVKLLARNQLGIADAVVFSSPKAVKSNCRLQPCLIEADVLTDTLERNVKLTADLVIHLVALTDIVVLHRAFRQVNAGVHLAVVSSRSLKRKVGFLFDKQNIKLPL